MSVAEEYLNAKGMDNFEFDGIVSCNTVGYKGIVLASQHCYSVSQ